MIVDKCELRRLGEPAIYWQLSSEQEPPLQLLHVLRGDQTPSTFLLLIGNPSILWIQPFLKDLDKTVTRPPRGPDPEHLPPPHWESQYCGLWLQPFLKDLDNAVTPDPSHLPPHWKSQNQKFSY